MGEPSKEIVAVMKGMVMVASVARGWGLSDKTCEEVAAIIADLWEVAEASKTELIREVRGWWNTDHRCSAFDGDKELRDILAKHEGQP